MKNSLKFVSALAVMFVIVMACMPVNVEAKPLASPSEATAGSWKYVGPDIMVGGKLVSVTGKEVAVDLTANPASSWLSLLSKGLSLSAPAKICHPFHYGLSGWVGEIRELKDGKWVKLTTTYEFGSDAVDYMACANATEAGTYALFGYYKDVKRITPIPNTTSGTGVGQWQVINPDIYIAGVLTKVTGSEVTINTSIYPAPTYRSLISQKGIKTNAGAKICHPFRLGQYNWVGEMYQLKAGKWVKLTTTNAWAPGETNQYMSCAQVSEAGTYALFAYYKPPVK